jgi:hypothetical protein
MTIHVLDKVRLDTLDALIAKIMIHCQHYIRVHKLTPKREKDLTQKFSSNEKINNLTFDETKNHSDWSQVATFKNHLACVYNFATSALLNPKRQAILATYALSSCYVQTWCTRPCTNPDGAIDQQVIFGTCVGIIQYVYLQRQSIRQDYVGKN